MKQECDRLVSRGVAVHQINYEDLIYRPADLMEGICRFLAIPFEKRMASLEGADRSAIYDGEHHEGVKSEKIAGKKRRPEVLPGALKSKIQRYTSFWRTQYGGAWPPASGDVQGEPVKMPGTLERVRDRLLFLAFRTLDAAVVYVYCFAPLWLLGKYRASKSQNRVASNAQETQPVGSVSTEQVKLNPRHQ